MKKIFPRDFLLLVICLISSALAGAAAGFWSSSWYADLDTKWLFEKTTTSSTLSVESTTTLALIPVESRAVKTLALPSFAAERLSPVGIIYKKIKNTSLEERVLSDDMIAGQAVALSSDGWFVTTLNVLDGLKIQDIVIWKNGTTYQIEKGIADRLSGTVYLKVAGAGLAPTALAHVTGLSAGAEIWVEARPRELVPSLVVKPGARLETNGTVSSEVASRRMILDGITRAGDMGGAVWDPNGSLVGLIDSKLGERLRIIPASAFSGSFASLLSSGEIKHAYLGVNAMDLGAARLEIVPGNTIVSGARLVDDKKLGKAAVLKESPAASAKLKSGDVILRVERDILDGSADLGEVLADYRPGASITLRVLRDSKDTDVPVVLGSIVTGEVLK
ncbi:MAG: PDZ domain-containing protein [Patescibacteria group bacterium]